MSMILKGIDLPQTLYTDIRIYWDGRIKKIIGENTMISYKNAQAIQIPKEHGKLIDADETRKQYYQWMEELLQSTTINIPAEALSLLCGFTLINNAPTILEAEGGE